MRMWKMLGLVVLVGAGVLPSMAEAAPRRWARPRPAHPAYQAPVRPWQHSVVPSGRGSKAPADLYYRSLHPKYQTGFHARDMQNLGVPTGDVGLRGNGFSWTPW